MVAIDKYFTKKRIHLFVVPGLYFDIIKILTLKCLRFITIVTNDPYGNNRYRQMFRKFLKKTNNQSRHLIILPTNFR